MSAGSGCPVPCPCSCRALPELCQRGPDERAANGRQESWSLYAQVSMVRQCCVCCHPWAFSQELHTRTAVPPLLLLMRFGTGIKGSGPNAGISTCSRSAAACRSLTRRCFRRPVGSLPSEQAWAASRPSHSVSIVSVRGSAPLTPYHDDSVCPHTLCTACCVWLQRSRRGAAAQVAGRILHSRVPQGQAGRQLLYSVEGDVALWQAISTCNGALLLCKAGRGCQLCRVRRRVSERVLPPSPFLPHLFCCCPTAALQFTSGTAGCCPAAAGMSGEERREQGEGAGGREGGSRSWQQARQGWQLVLVSKETRHSLQPTAN
jgi:hypothetical protein